MAAKPTSYMQIKELNLENVVANSCEKDRVFYQEKLFNTLDTVRNFKHIKRHQNTGSLPLTMQFGKERKHKAFRKTELFNEYFPSVFASKIDYKLNNIFVSNASLTNFSIAKSKLRSVVYDLDVSKTRGPNEYPPSFFNNSGKSMIKTLHLLLKNTKRLRKITK